MGNNFEARKRSSEETENDSSGVSKEDGRKISACSPCLKFSDDTGDYVVHSFNENFKRNGWVDYTHKDGTNMQMPIIDMMRAYIESVREGTWKVALTGEEVSNADLPHI